MKLSIVPFVAAVFASSAFAQNVDWSAEDTHACAISSWGAIKQVVDANMASSWDFLPPVVKDSVRATGALNNDDTLISNPTSDQIIAIARIFPSGIFHPFADNIVRECLVTYTPPDDTPTDDESSDEPTDDSSDEPSESSDEPSESSDEPTESSDEPTESSDEPTESSDEPTDDSSDEPTESSDEPTESSDEPTESSDEPTESSDEEPSSSAPIKCIPRPH